MTPISRIVRFEARPGEGTRLAGQLLTTASALAATAGCEAWDVHRETDNPDVVYVVERWSSLDHCTTALDEADNSERITDLLACPFSLTEAEPLGGARQLRGVTGATAFSILDAPDLSQDAELLSNYDLQEVSEARYVRQELQATQVGLTHYRLPAGRRLGWAHRHATAEEVYVVIDGSIRMKADEALLHLGRMDAARVAPQTVREFEAGPDGAEVLAFGTHVPGDGELVAQWWSD